MPRVCWALGDNCEALGFLGLPWVNQVYPEFSVLGKCCTLVRNLATCLTALLDCGASRGQDRRTVGTVPRPGLNSLLFSCQRVGADPGVGHRQPGGQVEGWQEGREGALEQVWVAADSVFRLAHVGALGKEAHVVGWRIWSREEQ